jgi:uncharacterized protein (TIGR03435 family)
MQRSLLAFVLCVAGAVAAAQNAVPAAAPFNYDVVTVKENKSAAYTSSLQFNSGDMLKADNANIMTMVCAAYDLPQYLVEGLPSWGMSKHFDVNGKILDASPEQIATLTTAQRRAMLAAVLQDRFGLKAHWETRDKPEYALVVAKSGSKLKESQEQQTTNSLRWNSLDAKRIGTEDLAKDPQSRVNKPVVDQTGLTGKYDMKFTWSVEGQALNGGVANDEETEPAIFTAVREALGLELKPTHGPVQVLVVDTLTQPSPN